jgi:hypothetical protein
VGKEHLRDPTLISSLLLLTRRRLLGQIPWIPRFVSPDEIGAGETEQTGTGSRDSEGAEEVEGDVILEAELQALDEFLPLLRKAECGTQLLKDRLRATSELANRLSQLFYTDVTKLKGQVLSAERGTGSEKPLPLLDLISIRVRGMVDRLYQALNEDLLPGLEAVGIQVRAWNGLMTQDRKAILEHFTSGYLPSMRVASEWKPSFIPDMPTKGCAVGLLARRPEGETRFFHVVIDDKTPSFLPVPGTSTVLPLEEVVRGYFLTEHPELERGQTYLFRFMTGGVMVKELIPRPEPTIQDEVESPAAATEDWADEDLEAESRGYFRTGAFPVPGRDHPSVARGGEEPTATPGEQETPHLPISGPQRPEPVPPAPPAVPEYRRVRKSVVVRVLVRTRMPEGLQAQLLRALEQQVNLSTPLIGWSDLYPVTGPLDLAGLDTLAGLKGE